MLKKIIVTGCLTAASFFIGCKQQITGGEEKEKSDKKELEMYETSELASLMRKMYEDNLDIKKQIEAGRLPESFSEDFYTIHTAAATPGMKKNEETFNALASEYLDKMKAIAGARTPREAKIAYNEMVMTCASCHQIYCQGPLPKIRKMKIAMDDPANN